MAVKIAGTIGIARNIIKEIPELTSVILPIRNSMYGRSKTMPYASNAINMENVITVYKFFIYVFYYGYYAYKAEVGGV